jgi:hypothetical protein
MARLMHKLGIIVDGDSEYYSYPLITSRIDIVDSQILNPLLAPIQPTAPAGAIARTCRDRAIQLAARGASLVIVTLDRESRDECPGELASSIADILTRSCAVDVAVVVKNRKLENWLIADMDALAKHPARFRVSKTVRRKVSPNKADACDALTLLKSMTINKSYNKVPDSQLILGTADPLTIAANSRSFRRLLRVLGHPAYSTQSRHPA